ncbi:jg16265 [Pararge aegeria aegeria]|uniref:Jg16265 protein n=1 Tax=Pararge aegeria aegeria TaxID=348720 RepID=A0A8S4RXJ7_9NEOP|nr:jg16265 [Pararge aegeria aegeria]
MDRNNIIECGGFYFIHNFDSGNLGHVERVPTEFIAPTVNPKTNVAETPDYEFNLWTRPDCAGTEFENGNRTWFYFGVQAGEPNVQVRLNLINLNKQGKMYNQGMAPVTRTLPGKPQWERIRDRPVHSTDDNTFTLTFRYRTAENPKATTFFAFTYPYSFAELQIALNSIDLKMLPLPTPQSADDIYYCRECLIYSLEGRRVDLLTISSNHGITTEREERLKNLFPENQERPFKFMNKKIIFISARVHPGETPSSFVFNGFLNLLLTRNDPIAIQLRKLYVFKMIPFLNPDGVARGHYRTDTRGVNLNRVYLNPSLACHPTVYASRALIRYYHFGQEKEEDICEEGKSFTSRSIQNISESAEVYDMKLQEMPSQSSDVSSNISTNADETTSLLNDNVLRSCLGSTVHLSTSEELNINGSNPLKPLRDTLKNSISLLMESSSSALDEGSGAECKEPASKVKMGWCCECRQAVARLEDTMPGITSLVPGYSAAMMRPEYPTYHSIEEYREHQRKEIDELNTRMNVGEYNENGENVYFCTNCFKRYIISENNEEIKLCGAVEASSIASVAVSAGDGNDVHAPSAPRSPAPSVGDTLVPQQPSPPKEEKQKPGKDKQPKKKVPATTPVPLMPRATHKETESGLYLYIDLHGHASKKGTWWVFNTSLTLLPDCWWVM